MIYLQHRILVFESKEICLSAAYESIHNNQFHCDIEI